MSRGQLILDGLKYEREEMKRKVDKFCFRDYNGPELSVAALRCRSRKRRGIFVIPPEWYASPSQSCFPAARFNSPITIFSPR